MSQATNPEEIAFELDMLVLENSPAIRKAKAINTLRNLYKAVGDNAFFTETILLNSVKIKTRRPTYIQTIAWETTAKLNGKLPDTLKSQVNRDLKKIMSPSKPQSKMSAIQLYNCILQDFENAAEQFKSKKLFFIKEIQSILSSQDKNVPADLSRDKNVPSDLGRDKNVPSDLGRDKNVPAVNK